tara:strand:+ start:203 stop:520 length:318 start_codon:yes stop_codon:yes gene_type:complete
MDLAIGGYDDLIGQIGIGGILGFVIGYAIKKILKFLLVLLGLFSALLIYLEFEGFVTIHYNKVEEVFTNFIENYGTEVALPSFIATNIPLAGSFALGFAFGIKKG